MQLPPSRRRTPLRRTRRRKVSAKVFDTSYLLVSALSLPLSLSLYPSSPTTPHPPSSIGSRSMKPVNCDYSRAWQAPPPLRVRMGKLAVREQAHLERALLESVQEAKKKGEEKKKEKTKEKEEEKKETLSFPSQQYPWDDWGPPSARRAPSDASLGGGGEGRRLLLFSPSSSPFSPLPLPPPPPPTPPSSSCPPPLPPCIVCENSASEYAFDACGHCCVCYECADLCMVHSSACPVCRTPSKRTLRIV